MPRDRARRSHFATAGIALALIVLWLVALASYRSIAGFDERMRSVAHTQEVLAGIHALRPPSRRPAVQTPAGHRP